MVAAHGSRVRVLDDRVTVGPDSVGFRLLDKALVFGGDTITATDVAVANGGAAIGDRGAVAGLDAHLIRSATAEIHRLLADGIDQ